MFTGSAGGPPFGIYAVAQNFNLPIQIQPQVFTALCLISWAQTLMYHQCVTHPDPGAYLLGTRQADLKASGASKWKAWAAVGLGIAVACLFAGIEAALILTLRVSASDRSCNPPPHGP